MVLGGMTDLIIVQGNLNAQRYIYILYNTAIRFMQNNERPYTARVTSYYLNQNHFNVLTGPPVSPDLNRRKHISEELSRKVES